VGLIGAKVECWGEKNSRAMSSNFLNFLKIFIYFLVINFQFQFQMQIQIQIQI
jgi:hypothetical protein